MEQWLIGDGTDDEALSRYWPGYVEVDPEQLPTVLASARIQCEAFAPSLTSTTEDGTVVTAAPPATYVLAQAMQARALYRSGMAGDGNQLGADGMAVTVFPMDWTVKNLLRPKRGVGAIA